jgi:hypothetical protein
MSCLENRVYAGSGRDCTCTGVGFDNYPDSFWCSDCLNVYFTPRFSSDLTLLVLDFHIDIQGTSSALRTNLVFFKN